VGLDAQCTELASRLATQLRTYGDEPIGVIVARINARDRIYEFLQNSPLAAQTKIMSSDTDEPWYDADRPICIMTIQAVKGSEFRAVHWLEADDMPYYTRQKAYVIVTRAKTALDVYYSKTLSPALRSAFAQLTPPRPPF
jgi:superfamily I DNA and RNA helicase